MKPTLRLKAFFSPYRLKQYATVTLIAITLSISIITIALAVSNALIIEAETSDPKYDTFGYANPQYDIIRYSISADAMYVTLIMTFNNQIAPPGETDGLTGFIDMDIDQNSGTGSMSHVDTYEQCLPPSNLGMEYYVDISTYSG